MPETPGAPQRTRPSPRELTEGLAPEVVRAGPPPTPRLVGAITVRPVRPEGADLDLVHAWMNLPHVAEFFGQAWPRERWADELAAQAGGDYARPHLVAVDGAEVAYIELYRAARDVIAEHYPADPHDVGLHIAIGVPERIGRGLGPRIMAAVAGGLFAADPRCRRVMLEPDAANTAARRAARRAGMHLLGEVELPHKRAALFVLPRTTADLPG
ncbi:Protein N-acetyltransferase, RimJ/RimL family [Marinactinospora thermotolerans DSM 45154]|uniref:Lysine N-acyltransferase MbtK n=1 Tax=Marinactinospora thermotolerans DSM 45154 TaxID=1122192 RepID=A0A1T4TDR1_9ACTN|nr:GNAT family N-acetyltransferase [Marinactinospora thermotolerans]SKA38481.1 Protein N-acetyltransferase, RimJ/RimL family [Marinactinospora thermotolerans DSM 45154]